MLHEGKRGRYEIMKVKTSPVRVIFKEIEAEQFFESKVMRNNKTSGKINAPKNWIKKRVIVIKRPSGRGRSRIGGAQNEE